MGVANGFGIAALNVSPFMMTLAMASIGFGLALSMTGGVPVYGMPSQFGATLGFGKLLGVPVPVYVTVVVILGMYVLLNWTRIGRYFYAIGGNIKASALSGISTRSYQFLAYVLCGFLASLGGVMLTARLETGEANIGAAMPLTSVTARRASRSRLTLGSRTADAPNGLAVSEMSFARVRVRAMPTVTGTPTVRRTCSTCTCRCCVTRRSRASVSPCGSSSSSVVAHWPHPRCAHRGRR